MHACREICFQFALALNIVQNCRDSIIQPMKESTYLNLSSVIGCVKRFLLVTEAHHTIKKNVIEILKHVVIESYTEIPTYKVKK